MLAGQEPYPGVTLASMRASQGVSSLWITIAIAACASPPEPKTPDEPPPEPKVLKVAEAPPGNRRELAVDARVARTFVGDFKAGSSVRIRVLEASWTNDPAMPRVGTEGVAGTPCRSTGGHPCIGGDGAAPLMGLMLVMMVPAPPGTPAPTQTRCDTRERLHVPSGVEFAVPEAMDLALAPNDWDNGLSDNTGSIKVRIEVANGPNTRARSRSELTVSANVARTPIGSFQRGDYVRVTVIGGQWTNATGLPLVGAVGRKEPCRSAACIAGDSRAPLMGLMMLVTSCTTVRVGEPPPVWIERRFIPEGVDLVVPRDAKLFLAPNDWEDGLANNAGSARVEIETP